jgi:hypothetical protein
MNEEPGSKGWWQTIPGILTATAGIVTAVAGLIVALHQAGFFEAGNEKAPQVQNGIVTPPKVTEIPVGTIPSAPKPSSIGETVPYSVTPSGGTEIRVGQAVYNILSARLDRYAPNKLSLRFEVRMTNNDRYDANFWAASFRLLVDGVLRAPVNDLNELVDGHSAKEGSVEFVIPDSTTDVGLQIGEVGEGAPAIPIALNTQPN